MTLVRYVGIAAGFHCRPLYVGAVAQLVGRRSCDQDVTGSISGLGAAVHDKYFTPLLRPCHQAVQFGIGQ